MGDAKEFKCVVWDLDNTLWEGILLESPNVRLRDGIVAAIRTLDERGILQSIASKNNYNDATEKLTKLGVNDYFLYPQIGWDAKSVMLSRIQASLNIGIDSFLFIDDDDFERAEVASVHPAVALLDARTLTDGCTSLLTMPRLNPRFISTDSALRRQMYKDDIRRKEMETDYNGPKEAFLASLGLEFTISRAKENDLRRAEELTVRTHQLNATGRTYSYEELDTFRTSPDHLLLICELTDRLGSYGKIGLALVEKKSDAWWLRLLLMSCRVMSRGVGTILLSYIMTEARAAGVQFFAEFLPTDRNRMMYITFKFGGFDEVESASDGLKILRHSLERISPPPAYVQVHVESST